MQIAKQLFFGTLCTVLGSIISWYIFIFIFDGDIRGITQSTVLLMQKTSIKPTQIELEYINQLKEADIILSAGELLGHIGYFYSTIIIILITLLTLVTTLTFFFVKSSAEERAENKAKEIVLRVIQEQLTPKLKLIDENSIKENVNIQLEIKLFDSLSFSKALDNKIYSQVENAIEDTLDAKTSELIEENQTIKECIQGINERMDNIEPQCSSDSSNFLNISDSEDQLLSSEILEEHTINENNIIEISDI